MSSDMRHVDFARQSEDFAIDIESDFGNQNNWIVTIRFYSYLHYVEQRLHDYDYESRSHGDRKDNILNCRYIDNKSRKLYRRLEDLSRDARYECVQITEDDVEWSEKTLKEGKEILGFRDDKGDHKYSV